MKLDLEKVWTICNKLSEREDDFAENNIYINLLSARSEYTQMSFESFLDYYSFKVEDKVITVYNSDGVPYESYNNEDYSYIPLNLLFCGEKELEEYVETAVEKELKRIENDKIFEKEKIRLEIERLTKKLNDE